MFFGIIARVNRVFAVGIVCIAAGLTRAAARPVLKADLTLAFLMLAADMYENRTYTILTSGKTPNINPAASAIINQYCRIIL